MHLKTTAILLTILLTAAFPLVIKHTLDLDDVDEAHITAPSPAETTVQKPGRIEGSVYE